MTEETRLKIKTNPLIHSYLRENSYHYKYLYRDDSYIKKVEDLAKEYYQERVVDKIERFKNKINLIQTFIDVMK